MPIYDYRCDGCGAQFELLVSRGDQVQCVSCRSEDVQRIPSLFAVQGTGRRSPSAAGEPAADDATKSEVHHNPPDPYERTTRDFGDDA